MAKKRKQAKQAKGISPEKALLLASIASDRARGWSLRKIAAHYGFSLGKAHTLACNVQIILPNAWHRARALKQAPLPLMPELHRHYCPRDSV